MRILAIVIFVFSFQQAKAQVLEGYWKGQFTNDGFREQVKIDLSFKRTDSGSYAVYSYTYFTKPFFQIETSKVYYERFAPDSVFLEEISEPGYLPGGQAMWLRFHKKNDKLFLRGRWCMATPGQHGSGDIYFRKVEGKRNKE